MVLFQSLQFKNSCDSFKCVYAKREENSFTARVKYSSVKFLSSPFLLQWLHDVHSRTWRELKTDLGQSLENKHFISFK